MVVAHAWSRALVTGSSSGIGEAFARGLAAGGTNLVLVARRAERLKTLAAELGGTDGVDIEVLPADLTTAEGLDAVGARLSHAERPVDLLVNNAGFGTSGDFASLPMAVEEAEIRLNVIAVVRLTRAALDVMLPRGEGGIVNVSSVAGFQPLPRTATYAATKAFVTSFTESVAQEVRSSGVRLQALCPGFTRTEFHAVNDFDVSKLPAFAWRSAGQVVDESLEELGRRRVVLVPGKLNKAKVLVVPGAFNKVLTAGSLLSPRSVVRRVAAAIGRR